MEELEELLRAKPDMMEIVEELGRLQRYIRVKPKIMEEEEFDESRQIWKEQLCAVHETILSVIILYLCSKVKDQMHKQLKKNEISFDELYQLESQEKQISAIEKLAIKEEYLVESCGLLIQETSSDQTSEFKDYVFKIQECAWKLEGIQLKIEDCKSDFSKDLNPAQLHLTKDQYASSDWVDDYLSKFKDYRSKFEDYTSKYKDYTSKYEDYTLKYEDYVLKTKHCFMKKMGIQDIRSLEFDCLSTMDEFTSKFKEYTSNFRDFISEIDAIKSQLDAIKSQIDDYVSENLKEDQNYNKESSELQIQEDHISAIEKLNIREYYVEIQESNSDQTSGIEDSLLEIQDCVWKLEDLRLKIEDCTLKFIKDTHPSQRFPADFDWAEYNLPKYMDYRMMYEYYTAQYEEYTLKCEDCASQIKGYFLKQMKDPSSDLLAAVATFHDYTSKFKAYTLKSRGLNLKIDDSFLKGASAECRKEPSLNIENWSSKIQSFHLTTKDRISAFLKEDPMQEDEISFMQKMHITDYLADSWKDKESCGAQIQDSSSSQIFGNEGYLSKIQYCAWQLEHLWLKIVKCASNLVMDFCPLQYSRNECTPVEIYGLKTYEDYTSEYENYTSKYEYYASEYKYYASKLKDYFWNQMKYQDSSSDVSDVLAPLSLVDFYTSMYKQLISRTRDWKSKLDIIKSMDLKTTPSQAIPQNENSNILFEKKEATTKKSKWSLGSPKVPKVTTKINIYDDNEFYIAKQHDHSKCLQAHERDDWGDDDIFGSNPDPAKEEKTVWVWDSRA